VLRSLLIEILNTPLVIQMLLQGIRCGGWSSALYSSCPVWCGLWTDLPQTVAVDPKTIADLFRKSQFS